MSLLAHWLAGLHPEGEPIAATLSALPCRSTYADVDDGSGDPAARALAATELSVRDGAGGLRLAFTVDAPRLRPGDLTRAVRRLGVACPDLPLRASEALRVRYPTLDWLIGLDADGPRRRGKLYMLRDRRAPIADFRPPLRLFLEAARVDVAGVERAVARLPGGLAFAAVDLWPDVTPAKVYLDVQRDEARAALRALGEDALVHQLDALPDDAFDQRFGCVLTLRWEGDRRVDTTLHVRAPADLDPWLGALASIHGAHQARAHALGARVVPRYLSWMARAGAVSTVVPTLYYQVAPR